nr:sulfite exporter TauE/SafE family protein [uncultured Limnohabitans sp.]
MENYLIWASIAAMLVGLSKGGLPTVGMLSVPILSLFMSPVKAAVMLLPIYVISDMVGIWLYRKNFSAINLKILIPAGVGGVIVGWLTASMVSDVAVKLLIGFMGIGFCLNTWLKRKAQQAARPADVKKGVFWGLVAGFTSFISHAGAPPFQVYMLPQKLPKTEFAGTATILFAIINAAKIWPYQQLRPYDYDDLMSAAVLIPFALIGTVVGAYLTKKIADVWFYKLVQFGLFVVSVKLIVDAVSSI